MYIGTGYDKLDDVTEVSRRSAIDWLINGLWRAVSIVAAVRGDRARNIEYACMCA